MDQKFVPQYNYISSRPPNAADKALDATLSEYMAEAMPLESDEGMEKRREVLVAVEAIFRNFVKFVAVNVHHMTEEEAEDAGGELRVSGSHRLGVRDVGADIDTICVAPHFVTREHFFDYLKKDFMTHPDVSDFNAIETAVVPIMAFDFMEISIDLLFARLSSNRVPKNFDILSDSVLSDIDEATEKSLNGPRVTDMIPRLACKAKDTDGHIIEHDAFPSNADGDNTFLVVLRCVRRWAKKRGLYGNKMGYLGGVNCNLLVAMVCQLFPHASASTLLVLFFRTYAGWAWPKPVMLNRIQPNPADASYAEQREVWSAAERWYDLMPIITPAYPAMNSSMSVSVHSREVMKGEFSIAYEKCKGLQGMLKEKGPSAWGTLFESSDFFLKYSHYLQINIVGTGDDPESRGWMGYVESRVRGFPQYLESLPLARPIHLYPVQSKTAKSDNSVCYFVGFNVDKDRFNPEKPLHIDSCSYNFHKMLTDKYKGTMKEGLDFYVEHFPWKKLPKEVLEPFGGREGAKALRKERGYGKYAVKEEGKEEEKKEDNTGTDTSEGKGEEGKDGDSADAEDDDAQRRAAREEIEMSRKRAFGQLYATSIPVRSIRVADGTPVPAPVEVVICRLQQPTGSSMDTAAAATEPAAGMSGSGNKTVKRGRGTKVSVAKAAAGEQEEEQEEEEEEEGESGMAAHLRTRAREVIWGAI